MIGDTWTEKTYIDVQISGSSLSERVLHSGLGAVTGTSSVEPGGLQGTSGVGQNPANTHAAVRLIQHIDLGGNLGVPGKVLVEWKREVTKLQHTGRNHQKVRWRSR